VKREPLEQYSFRWLSKAFAGYNVVGCLTDVANLVFAMRGEPPSGEISETETVAAIHEVSDKINAKNFSGLWIPTHLIHDCEMDDLLTWLLLTNIHKAIGSSLKTLIQLPKQEDNADIDKVAMNLKKAMDVGVDCQMFFDVDARNASAILKASCVT
jgi:hypothetical protein